MAAPIIKPDDLNKALLFPIFMCLLLGTFMLSPAYGFFSFVEAAVSSLDYYLDWSLGPVEAALIAIIPWIAYRLLETPEKRTLKNQLGLTVIFLLAAIIFFTLGFLLIELNPNDNPLLPAYAKIQPFPLYWAIWFAVSDLVVVVFYLINRKQTEAGRNRPLDK